MKTKILFVSSLVFVLNVSWTKPHDALPTKANDKTLHEKRVGEFSFFRAHRHGRSGIAVAWGVNSPQGLTSFVLQRTYEFPDDYALWEDIYEVGVSNANSYNYIDGTVYPGQINYRVVAMNGAFTASVSPICTVQIRQR